MSLPSFPVGLVTTAEDFIPAPASSQQLQKQREAQTCPKTQEAGSAGVWSTDTVPSPGDTTAVLA